MEATEKAPLSFEPIFTEKKEVEIERAYNTSWGIKRRIMMDVLSRSSEELVEIYAKASAEDDGEMLLSIIDQIAEYRDHLKAGVELATSALTRLCMIVEHISDAIDAKNGEVEA